MKFARAFSLLFASVLVLACGESVAQPYPSKPITFVVQFPAGGAPDVLGRLFGQKLTERLGHPVIIENKTGAQGIIATEYVKNAQPDGYTLLVGATGPMIFNPALYDKLPYDSVKDFVPIALWETHPAIFTVHPSVPANSLKEFIALAKSKPGKLFYSAGASVFQLGAEMFKKQAGIDVTFVPYKGSAPAIAAAIAGETAMLSVEAPTTMPHVKAGRMRPLAVTSLKRFGLMPDVPTVAESGFPDFELILWIGLFAPAGTPAPVVAKLQHEMAAILAQPDIKERLVAMGYDTVPPDLTPAAISAGMKKDIAKWTKVAKEFNIRAN